MQNTQQVQNTQHVHAVAPGRVNIIGDHTDYTGGLCLPMAIDLATSIVGTRVGTRVGLVSADEALPAFVDLDVASFDRIEPFWARYVGGVAKVVRPSTGLIGAVTTTVPLGAGLSSSAAFEVALALALGFDGSTLELARVCQRAENEATGVPTGILDQLASAAGREGHAMLLDCHDLSIDYVPMPPDVQILVVHSGVGRQLAASGYTERVQQCAAAESIVGPLRLADLASLSAIVDPVVQRRARHVVSENQRVRDFARAMSSADYRTAGLIMSDSHRSLRDDYKSSHPVADDLVASLLGTPGVLGARITGGGFGGCVVAMAEPDAVVPFSRGWQVRASAGARLLPGLTP
jgi:galactokinase